ncbi:MAG TPA: undecaprenyl-diphosphate phosphatase [Candidatus Limnocylindrales bacterium]|nr:undecaprenyl-diphosphate phosphatase [Candidatus Limnocylindrales bacterium]
MSFFQAIVLGLIQGVTELFPVSSLGHSVILPAFFGWTDIVAAQDASESYFLAFLVGLHVATALALAWYFRADWRRIIGALLDSIARRTIDTPTARLGWLLVVATIPAGLLGVIFEHQLRVVFAKPFLAGVLLFINGLILLAGERLRRRSSRPSARPLRLGPPVRDTARDGVRELDTLEFREAGAIGVAQVFALLAGISRSGITMVAGLLRGLDHEDAARFSFLLATPIILAAGVYKLPDLLGPNGAGVQGQVLAGSIAAALAAYVSVRFLSRYFTTRTLTPFALYCLIAGIVTVVRFHS